jgi:large subunit ribosomal protein L22
MEAKAIIRTARVAPRKARLVVDLIRGKKIGEALAILKMTPNIAMICMSKFMSKGNNITY